MIQIYVYTIQQLADTVRDLSGYSRKHDRQYVTDAVINHFSKLNEKYFPAELSDQYKSIASTLKIPESIDNKYLGSLVDSMDDFKVGEIVSNIVEQSQQMNFVYNKLIRSESGFF